MSKFETGDMFIQSIMVNGKEAHNGATLYHQVDEENGLIVLKTEIGKEKIQELVITLARDDTRTAVIEEPAEKKSKGRTKKLKVDEEKTSTD